MQIALSTWAILAESSETVAARGREGVLTSRPKDLSVHSGLARQKPTKVCQTAS
jgi:hypothetical protein